LITLAAICQERNRKTPSFSLFSITIWKKRFIQGGRFTPDERFEVAESRCDNYNLALLSRVVIPMEASFPDLIGPSTFPP